jgi:putative transposase
MVVVSVDRAYVYRFYPSKKKQEEALNRTLRLCCNLYNAALEERIWAHRSGVNLRYTTQANELPVLKESLPEYREIHSQVLQDVLRRLDRAFEAFFRRVKQKKGKAGFPRFKPKQRYRSFTYPQSGFELLPDGHIQLSRIGALRVFMHRKPAGKVKTLTLKRDRVGDWFVILVAELPDPAPRAQVVNPVGVDLGLEKLATLSTGECVEPPKYLRKAEKRLARAQRTLSRRRKGSGNRAKARLRVAKIHRKIERQRDDFVHKVSHTLAKRFDLIAFEDLNVEGMVRNNHFSKSMSDASWTKLVRYTSYKALSAGGRVVLVDPRGTSQVCFRCGVVVSKPLSARVHKCSNCGFRVDRDLNASLNILRKAVPAGGGEFTPVEMSPLPLPYEEGQALSLKQEAHGFSRGRTSLGSPPSM